MAIQKFEHILQSVNNSELRKALESLFGILGIGTGDELGSVSLVGDVTGDVIGDVTGNVTGALTGDQLGNMTGNVKADSGAGIVQSGVDPANSAVNVGTVTSDTLITKTSTPVNAVGSAGTLTSSGAATAAVHAVSVLTNDTTDIDDGKIITIGATVYRFKTTPAQAYDVLRGTSAANSIANLLVAINASGVGDGSDYFTGTLAHPFAYATASDATTVTVQILIPGDESNALVTESDDAGWTWTGADFAAGTVAGVTSAAATVTIGTRVYMVVDELSETSMTTANAIVDQILKGANEQAMLVNLKKGLLAGDTEGTEYSTGTVINADVTPGAIDATTLVCTAKILGVIGDLIAVATDLANTTWGGAVTELGDTVPGVDGTVGVKGQIEWDATNVYVCILTNTIADANWTQATMATF